MTARVYKSSKGKSFNRVKNKIKKRKMIKSAHITPLIEHESYQKETFFKENTFDFCFYKRPTFTLNMVKEIKRERQTGFSPLELEMILKHQVALDRRSALTPSCSATTCTS